MRSITGGICVVFVVMSSLLIEVPRALCADPPPGISTSDLELAVVALSTLDEFDLSVEQLKSLRAIARDTAGKPSPAALAKGGADYHAALLALRDAFVAGDDEKIDSAQEIVDQLRDNQEIDPETDVETSDAARAKAAAVLKLLTSTQLAGYISEHSDEVPDATETIADALDQCKDGSDAVFAALRDEAAEQVALLVAGTDSAKTRQVTQKVTDLLDKARKMSPQALENRRGELDKEARAMIGTTDSFDALRHWMAGEMADLLSNPQLVKVLDALITVENQG